MKKRICAVCAVLMLCLILCRPQAEENVTVEVIRADGISVVMLIPTEDSAGKGTLTVTRENTSAMLEKEGESGASVVVLTPGEASSDAKGGSGSDESKEGDYPFTLPSFLIRIEEDAFSGIGATSIYIGDRVEYIGSRAFAYCRNLRAIHIPASVAEIKPDAFNGCSNATLTIYGVRPSAAADFADTYGYKFVDLNASTSAPNPTDDPGEVPVPLATNTDPPVSLPFVPAH